MFFVRIAASTNPVLRTLLPRQTTITTRAFIPSARRTLSASAIMSAAKQEWVVILPDKPNSLSKRMEVRPQHLENIKPHVESGFVVMGGASLDEPIQEGEAMKINGSVMMAVAETKEEVQKWVEGDVYYKNGVWDADKIQIIPFKSAVRKAL